MTQRELIKHWQAFVAATGYEWDGQRGDIFCDYMGNDPDFVMDYLSGTVIFPIGSLIGWNKSDCIPNLLDTHMRGRMEDEIAMKFSGWKLADITKFLDKHKFDGIPNQRSVIRAFFAVHGYEIKG